MTTDESIANTIQSEDRSALLDIIDKLRVQGINQYISLPQIIVVGDQSSGKSSVLEAISGIGFPTNDGLCTRFATEVILRKSREEKACVRIRPSRKSTAERRVELESFTRTDVGPSQVVHLIAEATAVLGISPQSNFSEDVLEIEISGPKQPHLTLVDLPGLFQTTKSMTTAGDVALVENMVTSYMKEHRTIILAVVSARNDYQNQKVLQILKTIDLEGSRTMGVITKPDTIEKGSVDEATFLSLGRNVEMKFKLAWHTLRNPSFTERRTPGFDRDQVEKAFFDSTPWTTLAPHVGVESLRDRLSGLLMDHISSELPALIESIRKGLSDCKVTLDELGLERTTTQDKKNYLSKIAERFHKLAKEAVDGNYAEIAFFSESTQPRRLRAIVQRSNYKFAAQMLKKGHSWEIFAGGPNPATNLTEKDLGRSGERESRPISREAYVKMVCNLVENHRGPELPGNYNPSLVRTVFIKQSEAWSELAQSHAEAVFDTVENFVEVLLVEIAGEERADIILRNLIDPALSIRRGLLMDKVAELLSPYMSGHPMTLDTSFVDRFAAGMEGGRLSDLQNVESQSLDERQKMDILASSRLVECVQSYYGIALRVFVDNVATLGIENCALRGVEGLLSPLSVGGMSDEQIDLLASESVETVAARQQALNKQQTLLEGLKTCQRYAKRSSTRIAKHVTASAQDEQGAASPATNLSATFSSLSVADTLTTSSPEIPSTSSPAPPPSFSFGAKEDSWGMFGGGLSPLPTTPSRSGLNMGTKSTSPLHGRTTSRMSARHKSTDGLAI